MKKIKAFTLFSIMLIFLLSSFSCKKSVPEIKDESPTKDESAKQDATTDISKSTEIKRKITDEQFLEAQQLIERAKEAMADIYDKENYYNAINNLKNAKDYNENETKQAFEYLDISRTLAQKAFYNSYKNRALEKRNEADRLMADLEARGITKVNSNELIAAMGLYDEGTSAFAGENFQNSFVKYSESIDKLMKIKADADKSGREYESKIKFVQDLIKKAEEMGAIKYAPDELNLAKDLLTQGINLYKDTKIDDSRLKLDEAEKNALLAIEKSKAAFMEAKRLEALKAIKDAGKSVEKAAGKTVITEEGKADKSLDYKFEFDDKQKGTVNQSPDTGTTYKDILLKAVEYIEKAKEAFYSEDYDMAIKYAGIAKKIADSYAGGGIKTVYKVRLIPEKRDCLWRIAEYDFIYNNPFYWPMIWKTNKEKIINPDLIYPGQEFAIPELD